MKKLLLIAGIITSGVAFAQEDNDKPGLFRHKQQENLDSLRLKLENLSPLPDHLVVMPLDGKFSHTLPNGNKVFLLSQDNMPCIVPGKQHYAMPNLAGPKDTIIMPPRPGYIPNPGRKWKVIPIGRQR